MEYRKIKDTMYIRIDKGEEFVQKILEICEKEKIYGGYIQGIGGCDKVIFSTYIQEKAEFVDHIITGMVEVVSLMGNISQDNNGKPFLHCHGIFSYLKDTGEIAVTAGHLKEAHISYTGEIILTIAGEKIGRMFDEKAGIDVWKLKF